MLKIKTQKIKRRLVYMDKGQIGGKNPAPIFIQVIDYMSPKLIHMLAT